MTQEKKLSEELKITIVNYLSGKWDECDSILLKTWLEENEDNSNLFGQLVDLWEADTISRKEKEFNVDEAWDKLEPQIYQRKGMLKYLPSLSKGLRYAAILVFGLLLGGLVNTYFSNRADSQLMAKNLVEYTVPYGAKTRLKLPDGTEVILNAGTQIKYNQGYGTENRNVELCGEAFFEVAKNKVLPFIVYARHVSVQALGTKFNVKAYPEEKTIETILLEGSVELKYSGSTTQQSIVLKPNQKALFDTDINNFMVSAIHNTSEVSWTTDKWVVKNIKLDVFAKLLERRYNIVVEFNDNRIGNYEFGGTIKDETLEQVLTALTYSAPIKYKITNKHVKLFVDESKVNQYNKLLNRK